MSSATISAADVMKTCKVVAVVGASKNAEKEAHTVPLYLKDHGYRIIPVNPTADEILGERSFPNLAAIPEDVAKEVEVIEVFRPSEELPGVARQTVELSKRWGKSYIFWAQTGLENDEAKSILNAAGLPYVMNACMRVVHTVAIGSGRTR